MGFEVLAGRYALGGIIATGGMAVVHLGLRVGDADQSPVAIKRLHRHLVDQTEFVAMFLDEARLTKRLAHPNIVRTLDVVFGDQEVFLVMEYLEGETLGALRRTARAANVEIPVAIAARIMHDALEGLACAHETRDAQGKLLGVVHRDFSPANLMVGVDGVSKVLDFGVAKAEGRLASTQAGALKGKIAYMAPEQLLGTDVDGRTDVFAAGLMLWELLAARKAYTGGENDAAIIARVIAPSFPPPSSLRAAVPASLDAVALRALCANRDDRWSSAHEMAQALSTACDLATPEELAAFVASVSSVALAERRAVVAGLPEAIGDGSGTSSAERSGNGTLPGFARGPTAPGSLSGEFSRTQFMEASAQPPARPRWPWLFGLAVPAVAIIAWFGGSRSRETPPLQPLASTASALASGSQAAPSVVVVVEPAASGSARPVEAAIPDPSASSVPADSPPLAGPTATPSGTAARPPAAPGPGAGKKAGCAASPYTKGPGGILRVRPECL